MAKNIFYDGSIRTLPMSNYWVRQTGFVMPVDTVPGTYRIGYEAKQQNVGTLQVTAAINGTFMPPNLILQDGEMYCPSCRLPPSSTGDGYFKADRDLELKPRDIVEWFSMGKLGGKSGWFKNAFIRTVDVEDPEPGPEPEVSEFVACAAFSYIGDKFGSVAQLVEDIDEWLDGIPILGDYMQPLFKALAIPFKQAEELFDELEDWCNELAAKFTEAVSIDAIIDAVTSKFAILSYAPLELVNWLGDSLNEVFHLKEMWDWISNADEWIAGKVGEGVAFTADAIAGMFEDILDKVFER